MSDGTRYGTANDLLKAARQLDISKERFRQLGQQQWRPILDRVLKEFTRAGSYGRLKGWVWEDFREPVYLLGEPHTLRALLDFWEATTPVWLIVEDWHRAKKGSPFWVFGADIGAAIDALENSVPMECYIVARSLEWLIAENHHNVLFGVGNEAVRRLAQLESQLRLTT